MATVNFSVPDDVKREFNEVFSGENKSAIIVRLMREAIAEQRAREARTRAVDRLLELRAATPPVTEAEVRAARDALRE